MWLVAIRESQLEPSTDAKLTPPVIDSSLEDLRRTQTGLSNSQLMFASVLFVKNVERCGEVWSRCISAPS
jgi:hypothetical protein